MNDRSAAVQERPAIESGRLPSPVRITEQEWPDGTVPLVSVFCVTYNHERFIGQCLDGFLMQETTFPVEIIVHDDASTDRTADIVREYERRYPRLFHTILQTQNQRSLARKTIPRLMLIARGQYVAFCEGDDYWTYPRKLETQASILSARPDLAMVCHEYAEIAADGTSIPAPTRIPAGATLEYSDKDALANTISHLNTWLTRKKILPPEFVQFLNRLPVADKTMNVFFLQDGKGLGLGNVWSVYRRHAGGVWSTLPPFQQAAQALAVIVSQKNYYAPRYAQEYVSIVADYRRTVGHMLGCELLYGKASRYWKNLRYLSRFRSDFFPAFSESLRVALIGVSVALHLGFQGVLRRAGKRLGLSSRDG